jgi:hypothetical protein
MAARVGTVWRVIVRFKNAAGVQADPGGTVALVIRKGDGTEISDTFGSSGSLVFRSDAFTPAEDGLYFRDVLCDVPGTYVGAGVAEPGPGPGYAAGTSADEVTWPVTRTET